MTKGWVTTALAIVVIGCGGNAAPAAALRSAGSATPSATSSAAATPGAVSSPTATATAATPSPPPSAALPLGVFVKDFLVTGGATYSVSLVNVQGQVVATATAQKRSLATDIWNLKTVLFRGVQMPNVSASNTRLYYLDGDSRVMFLNPDGTTGLATTISVEGDSAAVFSVSPDDSRIAVAIITYPYPAKTRIYVEDLHGGGNHVELFSSTTALEWPVGWHQGNLVLGTDFNSSHMGPYEGFLYSYTEYHVADASTGNRIATVCGGQYTSGPPVPAGSVCWHEGPVYAVSDWAGKTWSPSSLSCNPALSTDGAKIGTCIWTSTERTGAYLARDGSLTRIGFFADPRGWIDANHVVVARLNSSTGGVEQTGQLDIVDTRSLADFTVTDQGFFGGTIPGAL